MAVRDYIVDPGPRPAEVRIFIVMDSNGIVLGIHDGVGLHCKACTQGLTMCCSAYELFDVSSAKLGDESIQLLAIHAADGQTSSVL